MLVYEKIKYKFWCEIYENKTNEVLIDIKVVYNKKYMPFFNFYLLLINGKNEMKIETVFWYINFHELSFSMIYE